MNERMQQLVLIKDEQLENVTVGAYQTKINS